MAESSAEPSKSYEPGLRDYTAVSTALAVFSSALAVVVRRSAGEPVRAESVVAPMVALVALTACVWLAMILVRNVAILRGLVSARYYIDYASHTPSERTERPARTFNNLMQVPSLFYVLGLLIVVTGHTDRAQLSLAWIYVAMRTLHAIVYVAWNRVPWRFACWVASCIALGVMWCRFAMMSAGSW